MLLKLGKFPNLTISLEKFALGYADIIYKIKNWLDINNLNCAIKYREIKLNKIII